jgi:single-strand DNA-binding protein
MNNITVAGIIGKDLELKKFGENVVGIFSVADSQGKEKPPLWWNCQIWGKRAESFSKFLLKGTHVTVTGSISEREWTAKDGTKNKSFDVKIVDVALQSSKGVIKSSGKSNYTKAKIEEQDDEIPF